jgi:hypothetical protein
MIDRKRITDLKELVLEKHAAYLDCEIDFVERNGEAEIVNSAVLATAKNEYNIAKQNYYAYLIHTKH